jgi:hypothetical protein
MKSQLLALMSTVAIASIPGSIMAQSMSPSLNCDPQDSEFTESGNAKLDSDNSVFDNGDGSVSSGGSSGASGGSGGTVGADGADGKGTANPTVPAGSGTGTGAGAGIGMIGGSGNGGITGGPGGTVSGGPASVGGPGNGGIDLGTDNNPAPAPAPTPAAPKNPPYVINGNVSQMTVTSKNGVAYYRAKAIPSNQQNLAQVKSYPTPSSPGTSLKSIGGQKILAKNAAVRTAGLSAGIVNIIDEINLTAAALGLPDPVITAGFDLGGHSPGSRHYSGNALDLRCNSTYASGTACKKWTIAMQNAFGPKYDVTWEDHGDGNSHIHLSYNG